MAQYRNINVRSPFYVQHPTSEASTSLELRIWEGDVVTDKPASPNYSLSKEQQGGQSTFEIAEIIRDFCSQTSTVTSGTVWVNTILNDGVQATTATYLASEGYTLYKDGVQHNGNSFESDFVALPNLVANLDSKRQVLSDVGAFFAVYVQPQNATDWKFRYYQDGVALPWTAFAMSAQSSDMFRYQYLTNNITRVEFDFNGTFRNVYTDLLDCNKWNSSVSNAFNDRAVSLMYVNKVGARSKMIFSLKHTETINVTDTTFQRNVMDTASLSNGAGLHASRRKITGSKQSFTINTDWLNEYHVAQLEELIMSEYVWAQIYSLGTSNYQPVNLKTSNFEKKNHLNDKLIQYTFDIETASEYINTVR